MKRTRLVLVLLFAVVLGELVFVYQAIPVAQDLLRRGGVPRSSVSAVSAWAWKLVSSPARSMGEAELKDTMVDRLLDDLVAIELFRIQVAQRVLELLARELQPDHRDQMIVREEAIDELKQLQLDLVGLTTWGSVEPSAYLVLRPSTADETDLDSPDAYAWQMELDVLLQHVSALPASSPLTASLMHRVDAARARVWRLHCATRLARGQLPDLLTGRLLRTHNTHDVYSRFRRLDREYKRLARYSFREYEFADESLRGRLKPIIQRVRSSVWNRLLSRGIGALPALGSTPSTTGWLSSELNRDLQQSFSLEEATNTVRVTSAINPYATVAFGGPIDLQSLRAAFSGIDRRSLVAALRDGPIWIISDSVIEPLSPEEDETQAPDTNLYEQMEVTAANSVRAELRKMKRHTEVIPDPGTTRLESELAFALRFIAFGLLALFVLAPLALSRYIGFSTRSLLSRRDYETWQVICDDMLLDAEDWRAEGRSERDIRRCIARKQAMEFINLLWRSFTDLLSRGSRKLGK